MNIKFNNLVIQDFKGIKNDEIPLKQNHLFYGPNASFKTSKLDAIT
jgi:recombinational DNA repair ATPase RecF